MTSSGTFMTMNPPVLPAKNSNDSKCSLYCSRQSAKRSIRLGNCSGGTEDISRVIAMNLMGAPPPKPCLLSLRRLIAQLPLEANQKAETSQNLDCRFYGFSKTRCP